VIILLYVVKRQFANTRWWLSRSVRFDI